MVAVGEIESVTEKVVAVVVVGDEVVMTEAHAMTGVREMTGAQGMTGARGMIEEMIGEAHHPEMIGTLGEEVIYIILSMR